MVWAQAFPFVALQFYEDEGTTSKETLLMVLIASAGLWLLLNFAFFCTVDPSYLNTFFGIKTILLRFVHGERRGFGEISELPSRTGVASR